jgi:hypothetical protein
MKNLLTLFESQKLEEIYQLFRPEEIVTELSFKNAMLLSYRFLVRYDDNLREYAVNLIEAIRQYFPKEWEKDWRNEVFLGDAYYIVMKYDERYEPYKRASKMIFPMPPTVMVSLARCYLSPNEPITIDEAKELILKALKKEKSIEAVTLIRGICKTKGLLDEFAYWDKNLQELEKNNCYMKDKWPELFDSIT